MLDPEQRVAPQRRKRCMDLQRVEPSTPVERLAQHFLVEDEQVGADSAVEPVDARAATEDVVAVISEERISLQLETEVSAVSETNSLSQGGLNIPGFSVRRAQTTVELASGGSLMIAGLLQSETSKAMAKLPGVANLPIIGDLLSSRSFQRAETELVIIVTPFLVRPYKDPVSHAEPLPVQAESRLSEAFADNIQRTYGSLDLDPALFNPESRFGYIID